MNKNEIILIKDSSIGRIQIISIFHLHRRVKANMHVFSTFLCKSTRNSDEADCSSAEPSGSAVNFSNKIVIFIIFKRSVYNEWGVRN